MHDRAMANADAFADCRRDAVVGVHDRSVLDVAVVSDRDAIRVAAQTFKDTVKMLEDTKAHPLMTQSGIDGLMIPAIGPTAP